MDEKKTYWVVAQHNTSAAECDRGLVRVRGLFSHYEDAERWCLGRGRRSPIVSDTFLRDGIYFFIRPVQLDVEVDS